MSRKLPLGRTEDQGREFEGRDASKRPDSIAREVVAMLNAGGGEVWVGIREERGRAIEVEGLEDAERERDRLRDAVVDLVEPPPILPEEVDVEIVRCDRDQVLRVVAKPADEHRPYALRRGGRLEFPVRFMDRVRPMTRQELAGAFASAQESSRRSPAEAPAEEERALVEDQHEYLASDEAADEAVLWLGIEPEESARRLDLEALWESGVLEDPRRTGNRWGGVNLHLALHALLSDEVRERPRADRRWLRLGRGTPFQVEIGDTAAVRSRVRLREPPFSFPPEPRESPFFSELRDAELLNPKALLEYPASLFRLLEALRGEGLLDPAPERIFAAVTLTNVEGWFLRPGPDHPAWRFPTGLRLPPPGVERQPRPFADGPSFVGPVLRFSADDLARSPDTCAVRLVTPVFAAFGWSADEIPFFDRSRGRLVLPR